MTFGEFINKYNIQLNEQQLAAVKSVEKPTLILAVPGSGKTRVLITRLGYMIYCLGIEPESILTLTYTVPATMEMKTRFAEMFGQEMAGKLDFRTINGIAAKIINYFSEKSHKEVYNLLDKESDRYRLLAEAYTEAVNSRPTESDLMNLSTRITYIKNMMLSKDEIAVFGEKEDIPIHKIFDIYNKKLRDGFLMDYDDQMIYAINLLKLCKDLLRDFQETYKYICVDEAQDTSKIQHELINMLAGKYRKLFMVGDEDQSIYGFRAAYPEALISFEENYPGANVLLMEENFRSAGKIVKAADRFVSKNTMRHEKHMKATRDMGVDIKTIKVNDRKDQYSHLIEAARQCQMEKYEIEQSRMKKYQTEQSRINGVESGFEEKTMGQKVTAVLYPENECILPVIDRLERMNIPYYVKNNDLTFFSNKVVKDIRDIILFAHDTKNTELFTRIYYKVSTYIGRDYLDRIYRLSKKEDIPILQATLKIPEIPSGTKQSVGKIIRQFENLLKDNGGQAIGRIAGTMGYNDYLQRYKIKTDKIDIIKAIAFMEPSAMRVVERLDELAKIISTKKFNKNSNFVLSTIHSSKGLEYDRVFIMDGKDGIFPSKVIARPEKADTESLKEYEEERRLYYVAVTRAKDELVLFTFVNASTFSDELLGLEKAGRKPSRSGNTISVKNGLVEKTKTIDISDARYKEKLEEIKRTGKVVHKKLGECNARVIDDRMVELESKTKKIKCDLRVMLKNQLIE